jgi:small-conductance mechanosensitive channel/CRP-like cAMP-binding protein
MKFLDALSKEVSDAHTFVLLGVVALSLLTSRLASSRPRLRGLAFFLSMHVIGLVSAAGLVVTSSDFAGAVRILAWIFGGVALVDALGVMVFEITLPRLRVRVPRIMQDVVVAIFSLITAVTVASRAGANLSGLIATSAVFTAILGFSLQDVIGNVAGGLALQLDHSLAVGDLIKVNDVSGRVVEIRWRYTAIETGNWETVLVPNTVLVKSQVTILGRRQGKPPYLRRVLHFNVDFRHQPSDVIEAVQSAIRNAKIAHVAGDPQPSCVLVDFGESYGRYALRYYLSDMDFDAVTDSEVRTHIFFALRRGGMGLSIPATKVFVTETAARAVELDAKDLARRKHLLEVVPLFHGLSEAERTEVAQQLKYMPFTRGDVITRQGDEAHGLFLIEEGTASVSVSEGKNEQVVNKLGAGSFFGEMSLLTGEPRKATVVAETDVECFHLDKNGFQRVLEKRPELARELATVLSKRRQELLVARQDLGAKTTAAPVKEADMFAKIRDFFELG